MATIAAAPLPEDALLQRYADAGAYTDCYTAEVSGAVTLERLISAFYSSLVFRPERLLIGLIIPARRAGASEVAALAQGRSGRFSAWTVEARGADQILLCDFQQRTRSWLMVAAGASPATTRLYFGSAVVQTGKSGPGRWSEVAVFNGLLWFHRLYSRVLLAGAVRGLRG